MNLLPDADADITVWAELMWLWSLRICAMLEEPN